MQRLVVFDLDGTLIDSQRDLADSANAMLSTYAAPPLAEDEVGAMVGDGARQLVVRALESAGVVCDVSEALGRFLSIYSDRLLANTRPYPRIPEVVAALSRRASLAVLTNKPGELSRRLLTAFDLAAFFGDVIGGDSNFPRKPDPAGLLHLTAAAGVTPQATVVVGDSMVDVETARRAGAGVLVARYGFGRLKEPISLQPGELAVDTPAEIPAVLAGFLGAAS